MSQLLESLATTNNNRSFHKLPRHSCFGSVDTRNRFLVAILVILFSDLFQFCASLSQPASLFSALLNTPKPIQISSTLEVRIDSFTAPSSNGHFLLRLCARQHDSTFDYQASPTLWSGDVKQACPLGRSTVPNVDDQALPLTITFSSPFSWPESFVLIAEVPSTGDDGHQAGSGILLSSSTPDTSNEAATIKLSISETNDNDAAPVDNNSGEEEETDGFSASASSQQQRTILRMVVHRRGLLPSGNWSVQSLSQGGASLTLAYRLRCASDLYGTTCTKYCLPRDNDFGHYTCDPVTGDAKCLSGWSSSATQANKMTENNVKINSALPCTTAVCGQNCSQIGGFCNKPGECSCREGWTGNDCNTCRTKPSCKYGTCLKPGDCICDGRWTGENCDKPVNLCSTSGQRCMENGGQCRNLKDGGYECICPFRRSGKDCDIVTSFCNSSPCLNGGTCIEIDEKPGFICSCSSLATGATCEQLVARSVEDPAATVMPSNSATGGSDTRFNIALIVENSNAGAVQSSLNSTQIALIVVFGTVGPIATILIICVLCILRKRRQRLAQEQQRHIIIQSSVPTVCTVALSKHSSNRHSGFFDANKARISAYPTNRFENGNKNDQTSRSWNFYGSRNLGNYDPNADNLRNLQRKVANSNSDVGVTLTKTGLNQPTSGDGRPLSWLLSSSSPSSSSPDAFSSTTMDLIQNNNNNNYQSVVANGQLILRHQHQSAFPPHHHQQAIPPIDFAINTDGNYDLPPPPYSPASAFTLEDCV